MKGSVGDRQKRADCAALPYNRSMPNHHWLTNHLLIAMPALQDPNFHRSVTYLCQHNEQGAMGAGSSIAAADLRFADVLHQMQIESSAQHLDDVQVLLGGPVQQERGFVLHGAFGSAHRWDSSFRINEQLSVTTSRDVLEALSRETQPVRALLALGYAGWEAGQLESELMENAWLTAEVSDPSILFDIPLEHRWQAAAALVGVDISRITPLAGHA